MDPRRGHQLRRCPSHGRTGNVVEAGGEVDLDTGLAQILYSQGYVEDVDGVLVGSEPVPEEPAPEAGSRKPEVERPSAAANKDEWSDYVEWLGGDPAGKTKAELIELADELEQ